MPVRGGILKEDDKPDPLLEEAMDWVLRLGEAPGDPETARRFEAWLSRSQSHVDAWNRACRAWRLMGHVPPAYRHVWNRPGTPSGASRRAVRHTATRPSGRRFKAAGGMAAAAVAVVVVALSAPDLWLRFQADHMTATAEVRIVELDDGSTVTLGGGSAIATDFDADRRELTILSGQAFFDVAHDPARPFIVEAKGVDVTVHGTAFDVQLSTRATRVALARGAVGLSFEHDGARRMASMTPEEMIVVDRGTGGMVRDAIALEDIAAWRNGRLFVRDATVGSVVEQLRRYHPAWISIPDGRLAAQRVTGLYDLDDPDRALDALVRPFGGKMRKISPYLRVLSRF